MKVKVLSSDGSIFDNGDMDAEGIRDDAEGIRDDAGIRTHWTITQQTTYMRME